MRITESKFRQIVREELINEAWFQDPDAQRQKELKNFYLTHPDMERRIKKKLNNQLLGKHLSFYKWIKDQFGYTGDVLLDMDTKLLGQIAGGILKDYTIGGVNPVPDDAVIIENLINKANANASVTGVKWYSGICYRGLVMKTETFAKGVDASGMQAAKAKPGAFTNPVDWFRSEITVEPKISNYYEFADRKTHDFFISFSTDRSAAKKFTQAEHAFNYWHNAAQNSQKRELSVINPLLECQTKLRESVVDPRVRAGSIDNSMQEGLNEVLACPYISKGLEIQRIFIPYENLERGLNMMGKKQSKLKSYLQNETRTQTYIEGDDLVIDLRG
jgi:hypothetical protein